MARWFDELAKSLAQAGLSPMKTAPSPEPTDVAVDPTVTGATRQRLSRRRFVKRAAAVAAGAGAAAYVKPTMTSFGVAHAQAVSAPGGPPCASLQDCPPGTTCQGGRCVPVVCPPPGFPNQVDFCITCIQGFPQNAQWCQACTDLRSDPRNCGTCGHACQAGEVCKDGVCIGSSVCTVDFVCQGTDPRMFCKGGPTTALADRCLCLRDSDNQVRCAQDSFCGVTCTTNKDCTDHYGPNVFCAQSSCCTGQRCVPICNHTL